MKLERVACLGGGPAGLYFSLLMKRVSPHLDIRVIERNRPDDTFGFGVVFSDATMENLKLADPESHRAITEQFWHWDEIHTFVHGEKLVSRGHGFAGMSRMKLLHVLQERARELGVQLSFEQEVADPAELDADLIIGADGVMSTTRKRWADAFGPEIDERPNRFVWLGTTFPFEAFTFYFKANEHGLFRVHAYRYEPGMSTFIVECTDTTFRATGLTEHDEDATIAYLEEVFRSELAGHRLLKNRSIWRRFPTVKNRRWHHGHRVLIGDAAHTAHFSVGSGTKLALEDAIALCRALEQHERLSEALETYEKQRRSEVDSLQRAAQSSLEWFESTERYLASAPVQLTFSMLTRSLRVTHEGLKVRDPELVRQVDSWFANEASKRTGLEVPPDTPPMFTPFRLRDLVLENRVVVSPMCQYSANDGVIDDWHLVHLGSRAVGGAGLCITEMTDVSRDARITPGCAGMYEQAHARAWRRVTDFVHEHSYAKIGVQLAHAGRKGATTRPWDGGYDEPLATGAWPIVSASALPYQPHNQLPRAMTREDMSRVRDDFVRAAQLANDAGFDLIELHCAHGYLLASFLSPLTNVRDDEYGGSLENRMRYPLEVFDAVRAAWPANKPISVRISANDWATGGNDGDDAVAIARALKLRGCDILDVSAGQTVADQRPRYGRLFQTPFSDRIRHEVGIPTMTVGAISSYADVNSILAAGRADLCVLARAHLFDPYWTRHAAYEQGYRLPWPKQYAALDRYTWRFK
jgi:anthraniloyl-CoA monooxygenase